MKSFPGAERIGTLLSHNVFLTKPKWSSGRLYILADKKDKIMILLSVKSFGKSWKVDSVSAASRNIVPANKFYAWLIKNASITLVSGSEQSAGGKKIWERLSKEPGIGVHGWIDGKAVNLGPNLSPETEDETHITWGDRRRAEDDLSYNTRSKEDNAAMDADYRDVQDTYKMLLVAFKK